ncbi:hypothetical protein [Cryobacterium sp. MLB-32]|nr:hypothetical protein [Cryobacterium sp. MLB-32]
MSKTTGCSLDVGATLLDFDRDVAVGEIVPVVGSSGCGTGSGER